MGLTFNANNQRIEIARGDAEILRVTVKNSSGAAYDVSANSFKFTVKSSFDDAIGSALFQLLNPAANGIDLTLAATGVVDVTFKTANAALLGMAGPYVYDLEMTDASGQHTLLRGSFFVLKDVSTPGSAPATPSVIIPFPGGIALTLPAYFYSTADALWHKMDIVDDGFGNKVWTDVGQNASYPF